MCGIAGCLQRGAPPAAIAAGLDRMLAALAHRGPDDRGRWVDPDVGLALGHQRLAVRDLSPAGHQPMRTEDGRWTLVYNGEIYNAAAIRRQLGPRIVWRGNSDTEVLLRAIQSWGLATTLDHIAGMFAFVVWDRERQRLTLVRDRLGIKPLYYCLQDGHLLWASELKALMAHPRIRAEVDPYALQLFMRFGYVPAPHCILQRTWKLVPGSWLEFDVRALTYPTSHVYWDAAKVARAARTSDDDGDDCELIASTKSLLDQIVQEHLAADVPLGAFLSGGIDSSVVAGLMQARSVRAINTFAIGFEEPEFDEAPYARRVAAALGTRHHEHYVSTGQVVDCVPQWAAHYCEPFSDTSGLPTLLLCREARRNVTVVLTGDGGDELFAGYRRYQQTLAIHRHMQRYPRFLRRALRTILSTPSSAVCDRLEFMQRAFAANVREGLGESIRKTCSLLASDDARSLYECLASISFNANATGVLNPDAVSRHGGDLPGAKVAACWQDDWQLLENMQLWDSQIYLANDILHKVDMASMSVGLEVRVPLLDHRLFERAWKVPNRLKFNGGRGKLVLRHILADFLPESLFDRPKRGFSAPLDGWLRGPLRDWAEGLLEPTSLQASGLINTATARRYWNELLSGRAGHARIWPILVFLAWQQNYLHRKMSDHEYCLRHACDDSVCVGSQP